VITTIMTNCWKDTDNHLPFDLVTFDFLPVSIECKELFERYWNAQSVVVSTATTQVDYGDHYD
jgi:hypothetical protein